jgi:translation initiation factor IF-3
VNITGEAKRKSHHILDLGGDFGALSERTTSRQRPREQAIIGVLEVRLNPGFVNHDFELRQ